MMHVVSRPSAAAECWPHHVGMCKGQASPQRNAVHSPLRITRYAPAHRRPQGAMPGARALSPGTRGVGASPGRHSTQCAAPGAARRVLNVCNVHSWSQTDTRQGCDAIPSTRRSRESRNSSARPQARLQRPLARRAPRRGPARGTVRRASPAASQQVDGLTAGLSCPGSPGPRRAPSSSAARSP